MSSRARWSASRTDRCGSSSENRWREGKVDYEPRTIEDVRDGKVDLAKVSARAFDLVGVNSLQPLVAPFAVDSYALERRVLQQRLPPRECCAAWSKSTSLASRLLPGDLRKPLGFTRRLVEAADYRGATIGPAFPSLAGAPSGRLAPSRSTIEPGGDISSFDGSEVGLTGLQGDRLDGPAAHAHREREPVAARSGRSS